MPIGLVVVQMKTSKQYVDDYTAGKGDSRRVEWNEQDRDRFDKIFKKGKYEKSNPKESDDK